MDMIKIVLGYFLLALSVFDLILIFRGWKEHRKGKKSILSVVHYFLIEAYDLWAIFVILVGFGLVLVTGTI